MTIQQLSQDIGIGIDTLRVWERRYGFPAPGRDSRGHRSYSHEQVEALRVVKKLQDLGLRPGKIFKMSSLERRELLLASTPRDSSHNVVLQQLAKELSPKQIDWELHGQLQQLGLSNFIHQFVLPLLQVLDQGWTDNNISIAREHLVSDSLEQLLREQLLAGQQKDKSSQILFLTLSGERHKLGLLMAAALFSGEGINGIFLNEEIPLTEVPKLASELKVKGVALSFSCHYSLRQAKQDLSSLRKNLDQKIKLIVGGHAVQKITSLPNLLVCTDLQQIPQLASRHFRKPKI